MIRNNSNKFVKAWLLTGVTMVLVQVILGAVTRLTGSGLSITRWDIVTGILYPFNDEAWNDAFALYKLTPQYQQINEGMSLSQFKFIYFWEYFHRLWARLMGVVFLFPFLYFLSKGALSKKLIIDLFIVVFLAAFVASLGWIMVASGFIERPWVNAYKLSFHLCAALIMLSYLWWTTMKFIWPGIYPPINNSTTLNLVVLMSLLMFVQIFLGGVMSGMKAGLVAPTWPDMGGGWWPAGQELLSSDDFTLFGNYESNPRNALMIQFLHRNLAYVIFLIALTSLIVLRSDSRKQYYVRLLVFFGLLSIQVVLGIITLINCVGRIPLLWASVHQMTGFISFLFLLYVLYTEKYRSPAYTEKK